MLSSRISTLGILETGPGLSFVNRKERRTGTKTFLFITNFLQHEQINIRNEDIISWTQY